MKLVVGRFNIRGVLIAIIGAVLIGGVGYVYFQSQKSALSDDTAARITIDPAKIALEQMATRQKAASLLMLHAPGRDSTEIAEFVDTYQPGGIILMGDNISEELTQVASLARSVQEMAQPFPLLIAIDQEGCTVKRLPQDTFQCTQTLKDQPASKTEQAFAERSQLLAEAGINLNFGVVADMTNNLESFIYPRVFGHDAELVSQHIESAISGAQPYVWSTIKHFPGHGETAADSHTVIPKVDTTLDDWRSYTAIPFERGIAAGAEAVMMSHLMYSQVDHLPASLSPRWHTILRQDLDFGGLIVTDDLIMLQQSGEPAYQDVTANVIASIKAGNNLTLLVNNHQAHEQPQTRVDIDALLDAIVAAIENGQLKEKVVDSLAYKNLQWRQRLVDQ